MGTPIVWGAADCPPVLFFPFEGDGSGGSSASSHGPHPPHRTAALRVCMWVFLCSGPHGSSRVFLRVGLPPGGFGEERGDRRASPKQSWMEGAISTSGLPL